MIKEKIFSYLLLAHTLFFGAPFSFWGIYLPRSSQKMRKWMVKIIKILAGIVRTIIVGGMILFIRCIYRSLILPWLHGDCRFHPTCSEYCIQAFQQKPLLRAIILVIWRIARCHPWGKCGDDPLPPSLSPSS